MLTNLLFDTLLKYDKCHNNSIMLNLIKNYEKLTYILSKLVLA